MGFTQQTLPNEVRSIFPGQTLAGRALSIIGEPTASTDPEVIFIPFLKMLGEIRKDNVLVIMPNDEVETHLGELSSETAQHRGARCAVINGGVRDTEYIGKIGFPVFARYRTPRDPAGAGDY
jgi:4-hydroxy-4-methyl-2-oxoglutarate aldolase